MEATTTAKMKTLQLFEVHTKNRGTEKYQLGLGAALPTYVIRNSYDELREQ
jgi:hypothetical protein